MEKIHLIVKNIVLLVVLILGSDKLVGQSSNATFNHKIKSSFNGKTYELNVALPKKYSNQDTVHYPVLYVLDGKFSFNLMHSIREVMDLGKELKDIIIVSIDAKSTTEDEWFASRYYDLTPSSIPQADTLWSKIMNIAEGKFKSGGADNFLNTIEQELIPFVNAHYKTSADRGLSGHSLGGLFTGYCFLKKPKLFNRYGINSPSFWWNNSEMGRLENDFASQNTELSAKVSFSVVSSEDAMLLAPFNAFTNALKSRNYKGLTMNVKIFDGETHSSVVAACSSKTLKVLYGATVK